MEGDADGRGVAVVSGLSAGRLEDADDLVALHPPMEQDWLVRFVRRYLRILFLVFARCTNHYRVLLMAFSGR